MLVMTTIYLAEVANLAEGEPPDSDRALTPSQETFEERMREMVSLYEGKNRVLRLDVEG